jgi:hypothetical protein
LCIKPNKQKGNIMPKKFLIYIGLATTGVFASAVLILFSRHLNQTSHSPYMGQLDSPVRGLSSQEVDDLLNGRGAGYARTAELNNYPGPRHVLDLKQELSLSPDQETQIQTVFEQMQAKAKHIGQEIVQREGRFSAVFAHRTISEAELQAQTRELASLYGQLRAIHLQAHLQITPLLSTEQIVTYNILRGYNDAPEQSTSNGPQHQGH